MRIGVLGTGVVGQTLAGALAPLGHDVAVGTRDVDAALARKEGPWPGMPTFREWHETNPSVRVATFSEAAADAEVVVNATSGTGSLDALRSAGQANLGGKVLIDVSNPLDFSRGFPPTLSVANDDSLAERIQREFPDGRVVKTLNTVTAPVMVDPSSVGDGDHHVFVSGNDRDAKADVASWLREWFGWREVVDLGDITTARGTEMYLALWVRLMAAFDSPMFNVRIVK
jgi:8-hydroxy-5-deazaflavin:NADPH oxidoreductase